MTFAELEEAVRMPWGAGFPAEEVLLAANFALELKAGDKYALVPLWELPELDGSVYLIAPARKACTPGAKKPTAIICPGGAYSTLSIPSEGLAYADALAEKGFVPFVLVYRVAPNRYPQPHEDLALAIKYVRKNSDAYGLDPDELMLVGSSAGGHLCASFAASPDEYEGLLMEELSKKKPALAEQYRGVSVTPQRLALAYPAISFVDLPDDDPCYFALTGGDGSLREKMSVETQVTADFPKTFIWACEDDELVPVSKGGSPYARDNVGASHRACNGWRSARDLPAVEAVRSSVISSGARWSTPEEFVVLAKSAEKGCASLAHRGVHAVVTTTEW